MSWKSQNHSTGKGRLFGKVKTIVLGKEDFLQGFLGDRNFSSMWEGTIIRWRKCYLLWIWGFFPLKDSPCSQQVSLCCYQGKTEPGRWLSRWKPFHTTLPICIWSLDCVWEKLWGCFCSFLLLPKFLSFFTLSKWFFKICHTHKNIQK